MKISKEKLVKKFVLRKIIVFFCQPILSSPKVSILQAIQCSDTICSGPAPKIGKIRVLCKSLDRIVCTHSPRCNITTKVNLLHE